MKKIIRSLGKIWKAWGEPFPRTARFFRHTIPQWIMHERMIRKNKVEVAVIIPCHNYGQYLSQAIESVLAQTVIPQEILVVDDASDDNTRDIALQYAKKGVSYLRVANRNLSLTRNSGAAATHSRFLMYLDADDRIPPEYIERCMEKTDDHRVGIVYTDAQEYNERWIYRTVGRFDKDRLTRHNFITSHALIRRQCFDIVGGYRAIPHSMEDWDFNRRVVAAGYRAEKADTYSFYNIHEDSMLRTHVRGPHYSYINDAALLHHPITIFTPFCGRREVFDEYLAGLLSTDIDPSMIRLVWYNTAEDPAFDALLREKAATLPFASVQVMRDPLPSIWGHTTESLLKNRIGSERADYYYQLAVIRAYNVMIRKCDTEYVLTLEDDNILKPDTLRELLSVMHHDVAAVIAPYRSRFYPRYEVWDHLETGGIANRKEKGMGTEEVGGCGFGCTLFRTEYLRNVAPLETRVDRTPKEWYDQLAYTRLADYGRILCNWDCEVEHKKGLTYAEKLYPHFT